MLSLKAIQPVFCSMIQLKPSAETHACTRASAHAHWHIVIEWLGCAGPYVCSEKG